MCSVSRHWRATAKMSTIFKAFVTWAHRGHGQLLLVCMLLAVASWILIWFGERPLER